MALQIKLTSLLLRKLRP